jgi:hypothetical protein
MQSAWAPRVSVSALSAHAGVVKEPSHGDVHVDGEVHAAQRQLQRIEVKQPVQTIQDLQTAERGYTYELDLAADFPV